MNETDVYERMIRYVLGTVKDSLDATNLCEKLAVLGDNDESLNSEFVEIHRSILVEVEANLETDDAPTMRLIAQCLSLGLFAGVAGVIDASHENVLKATKILNGNRKAWNRDGAFARWVELVDTKGEDYTKADKQVGHEFGVSAKSIQRERLNRGRKA